MSRNFCLPGNKVVLVSREIDFPFLMRNETSNLAVKVATSGNFFKWTRGSGNFLIYPLLWSYLDQSLEGRKIEAKARIYRYPGLYTSPIFLPTCRHYTKDEKPIDEHGYILAFSKLSMFMDN